jgi:hypothetical protein
MSDVDGACSAKSAVCRQCSLRKLVVVFSGTADEVVPRQVCRSTNKRTEESALASSTAMCRVAHDAKSSRASNLR